ncbi:hypothetical protein [Flavobacterium acetivorans]|uniref:hypothetical protein n=1 Tax=Flavobacterium acetivorans TaxID=2893883 RepID=UPI001E346F05|nr:hypothetical protein [Flavobacterium sp. F-29]UFH34141.1 hypothetical protein LNP19_08520 [Flavobacterium sp. F-29]
MKLKKKIIEHLKHYKRGTKIDLTILDDILPSTLSPWRSYEYAELSKNFPNTRILTDQTTFKHFNQGKSYQENLNLLLKNYPSLTNKIKKLTITSNLNGEIVYLLFYNNIKKHFEALNKKNNPFTFTLYPGGGFVFNDTTTDENLKKYFNSANFKGVIVNQNITKKYLIENQICDPSLINLIPGVPLNLNSTNIIGYVYDKDLSNTNILFFANKYTTDGSDKGFDIFQNIVSQLYHLKHEINFIVIGGFSEKDITINKIKNVIVFKGVMNEFEFETILKETHIMISPNKPFILNKGAFDGFPLATSVTASLFGNVNFMTDYFNESEHLDIIDGMDFVKLNNDINETTQKIITLHYDKELLKTIAINGRNKILHLYSYDKQITPRINHFKKLIH